MLPLDLRCKQTYPKAKPSLIIAIVEDVIQSITREGSITPIVSTANVQPGIDPPNLGDFHRRAHSKKII